MRTKLYRDRDGTVHELHIIDKPKRFRKRFRMEATRDKQEERRATFVSSMRFDPIKIMPIGKLRDHQTHLIYRSKDPARHKQRIEQQTIRDRELVLR